MMTKSYGKTMAAKACGCCLVPRGIIYPKMFWRYVMMSEYPGQNWVWRNGLLARWDELYNGYLVMIAAKCEMVDWGQLWEKPCFSFPKEEILCSSQWWWLFGTIPIRNWAEKVWGKVKCETRAKTRAARKNGLRSANMLVKWSILILFQLILHYGYIRPGLKIPDLSK